MGVRLNADLNVWGDDECLYSNSNQIWLARPEGDDASDGIVGRNPYGHAISRDNFDAEAAHTPAELSQHFMAGVALNPVKASAVDSHYRTLHVDEIVLAQTASNPFIFLDNNCATFFLTLSGSTRVPQANQSLLTASSTCLASAS